MEDTIIESNTCHTSTDPPLSVLIREAIVARTETTDCEPLYDVIDPDALEALFASTQRDTDRTGSVTFQYCGYQVTVFSDRTIDIDPLRVVE
ncbi:HalOD1 output domain-containing protein [Haladaptatus halobius]|uniref:HalOD1 output domain-containing protein n=1 Tax=Haladaptatus halobius TaxID=2884875 RepID=UPI001D0B70A2|nr:HalOD1 output domain-containing protein [Haladaptatus halobius]